MTQEVSIKYERLFPIMDRILLEVINLTGEKNDGEQNKLRDIAKKKILDQPIDDFEITKAMNNCGIVRAAGLDARWVTSGDIVFFGTYAGTEIKVESQSHLMIRETDVLFILK